MSSCEEWKYITKEHEDYNKYLKESFDLYKKRPIQTPIDNAEKLFDYYPCNLLLLFKKNNILGGIMWWNTNYGHKLSTSFSVSSSIYKDYVIEKYYELLNTNGYYAELSDALEYLLRKKTLDNIKDINTISKVIEVDEENIFKDEDDERRQQYKLGKGPSPIGSYLRYIKGIDEPHRKALYGKPCLNGTIDKTNCNSECIQTGGNKKKKTKKAKSTMLDKTLKTHKQCAAKNCKSIKSYLQTRKALRNKRTKEFKKNKRSEEYEKISNELDKMYTEQGNCIKKNCKKTYKKILDIDIKKTKNFDKLIDKYHNCLDNNCSDSKKLLAEATDDCYFNVKGNENTNNCLKTKKYKALKAKLNKCEKTKCKREKDNYKRESKTYGKYMKKTLGLFHEK